jgi:two-component system chemotaxis sensor kinase CheA
MSKSVDLKEFVAGFLLEADEHLHSVNQNLVLTSEALKKGLAEPRAIRELFRSIHTVKGLASMVGAEPIVDLTHEMENILRNADRAGGKLNERLLDLILQGARAIEERIRYISKNGMEGMTAAPKKLLEALSTEQLVRSPMVAVATLELQMPPEILKAISISDREQVNQALDLSKRVVVCEFQPSSEKAALGFSITSIRDKLGKIGELVKVVPHTAANSPTGIAFFLLLVTEVQNTELANALGGVESDILEVQGSRPINATNTEDASSTETNLAPDKFDDWAPSDHASIRVDVRRLDEALERLSELVVTRFKMVRVATKLAENGADTRIIRYCRCRLCRGWKCDLCLDEWNNGKSSDYEAVIF